MVSNLSLLANLIHSLVEQACVNSSSTLGETKSTGYWFQPVTGPGWLDQAQFMRLG
jgi:hypothetical protein